MNIIERILRKLPDNVTDEDCWITTYAQSSRNPYPTVRGEDGSNTRYLHRTVWEAHNAEPIPEGMVLRHTCDNPACCNPNHLVLGTQQDNVDDMHARGRQGKPRYDHNRMRELRDSGCTFKEIGEILGCNPVTVFYALK